MTLARKTPLRRKRPIPRTWKCPGCLGRVLGKRCVDCGTRKGTGRKSISARCDALWARVVKAVGSCEVARRKEDWPLFPLPVDPCSGRLEAAHVVPRRHRSVRWDFRNGRCLCAHHHAWMTVREKAWRDFIGPDWDALWEKAQERWNGEYPLQQLQNRYRAA